MNVWHSDRFHALKEEDRREAATRDLVDDVLLGLFDADSLEPVRQVPVAQVPALQFAVRRWVSIIE